MNRKFLTIALGILTAGAMVAQTAQTPAASSQQAPQQQTPAHSQQRQTAANRENRVVSRLTMRLNLTADQQTQVRAILTESRQENHAQAAKFREERMALDAAVKAGNMNEIDQLTQQNRELNAKVAANHWKTVSKIYSILTPDQKAKFNQRLDRLMGVRSASGV